MLLDKIDFILDKTEQMIIEHTKKSSKPKATPGAPLQVYNNRMIYSNNVIVVENKIKPQVFIIHDNPNFFVCEDEDLIDYTLGWIKTLEKKAYNLSQASGHHRILFFKLLHAKVASARKKIMLLDSQQEEDF